MRILVCVKQVPGTNKAQVDPETGLLIRSGVRGKLNPYDLFAVEAALRLREEYGGTVTTLTMGPPQAREALLETVYIGADNAVLLSDRRVAGSDVLATAYALKGAVAAAGEFDLILCGKQTTDGDTAQVGAELAEWLGLPHAGNVLRVFDVAADALTVTVNRENETVIQRMPLPCLLCFDADVNSPRLPSYRRRRQVGDDCVRTLSVDDFDDTDSRHYGLAGSATQVERIFPPKKNSEKTVFTGSSDELARQLYDLLAEKKYL